MSGPLTGRSNVTETGFWNLREILYSLTHSSPRSCILPCSYRHTAGQPHTEPHFKRHPSEGGLKVLTFVDNNLIGIRKASLAQAGGEKFKRLKGSIE